MSKPIIIELTEENKVLLKPIFTEASEAADKFVPGMILGQILQDGKCKVQFVSNDIAIGIVQAQGGKVNIISEGHFDAKSP